VRALVLTVLALGVVALFVRNMLTLAGETGPLVWVAAALAGAAGAGAFLLLAARPPAFVERLTGARRGLLPILAAGLAVILVTSAPPEGQLVSLAFFAGLLLVPISAWVVRRGR
jgi:hypothetical protein